MTSLSPLPDTARQQSAIDAVSLERVGMESIYLPIVLREATGHASSQARVAVSVDLPGHALGPKGIHMSRLYQQVQTTAAHALTPTAVKALLQAMLESHHECHSRRADTTWHFDYYLPRKALVTHEHSGWQRYPVRVSGHHTADGDCTLSLDVDITYSSTCPCSAALSRQYIAEAFAAQFAACQRPNRQAVYEWLLDNATLATPHSQRSIATLQLPIAADTHHWGLPELITLAEELLQTPVQTLVKRADEQAFAVRNGSQLMYVEDASRILLQGLQQAGFTQVSVKVQHQESLHAHDAVAFGSTDPAR